LRHKIIKELNIKLGQRHAVLTGHRMVMWKNPDQCLSPAARLSKELIEVIERLPNRDTGSMCAMNFFFPGCNYIFSANSKEGKNAQNREVTNVSCMGDSIILDPREAKENPDDLSKPHYILKYPPLCVFVKPDGPPIGDVCQVGLGVKCMDIECFLRFAWHDLQDASKKKAMKRKRTDASAMSPLHPCPINCIPMTPEKGYFEVKCGKGKIPSNIRLFEGSLEPCLDTVLKMCRTGVHLYPAYAVTDFFAQGMSFRGDPWLLHLSLPDEGKKFTRANLLIPISRPSLWSQLKLLTPLWPFGKKREFIEAVRKALKPDPDLLKEMERAEAIATGETMQQLKRELEEMGERERIRDETPSRGSVQADPGRREGGQGNARTWTESERMEISESAAQWTAGQWIDVGGNQRDA
jgi:hypothetical protein